MRYIDLIRAIKAQPDGLLYVFPRTDAMEVKLNRLQNAGVIEHVWCVNHPTMKTGYRITTVDRTIAPKQPEISAPDTVQVKWWNSGARKGAYSQQAYPVLSRTGKWVTIELMNRPRTILAERTKAAA